MFDKEENAVTIACDAVWKSSPFNFALEKVFPTNVDIGGSDSDSDYYVLPPQQGAIGEVADLGQKSAINDAIKELATSMLMEDRLVFGFAHRLASIVFFNVYTNVFLLPDASELEYRSSIVDSLFEMAFSGTSYMRPRTGPKHDAIVEVILENVRGLKFTAVFAEVVGNPQFQDDAKARRDTKKICKAMASELNVMQQVTEGKKVEKLAVFGIVIHQATYDILAGRIVGGRTVIRKIKSGCFGRVADEWNQWKEVLADMLKIRFRVAFCHNVLRKAASRWTGPAPSLEFTITPSKRRRSSASAVLPAKRARDADNL
ncbi:hypothetical protein BC832DRAFT_291062 [Gaertneriomyces semiglobifer]|nr:hypothetical protein BC832DRAFT_291062 [Gaertneriomyces semiglobifer]